MNEEEIIDIAENIANFGWSDYDDFETNKQAIQGILDLYNKEKEKNKILKSYSGNLPENVEMILLTKNDFERNISDDYIRKDKIKEKIEKLETECDNCTFAETFCNKLKEVNGCTNGKLIKILEELLQEGDDK